MRSAFDERSRLSGSEQSVRMSVQKSRYTTRCFRISLRRSICLALWLATWFGGAPCLRAQDPGEVVIEKEPLGPSSLEHWAFRPLQRPQLPEVRNVAWCLQPIDRFVLARWEHAGIEPLPPASYAIRLRRVCFYLWGLPPPAEWVGKTIDGSQSAWCQRVEQLLASPHFGPRWAQFWLDLARFAETDGFEFDKPRPQAWQYRDWVIRATDSDMPYNQFIAEQIAGDLLHPDDPEGALPTAFCLSGPDMPDLNDQRERRHVLLNEMTATVGSVFLALQLGCAQCHDHKYDPVTQVEFYSLRAFFENTIEPKRDQSLFCFSNAGTGPLVGQVYARGDWRRPTAKVLPDVPRVARLAAGEIAGGEEVSGRDRRSLAEWLGGAQNGLVARVIANRVWQFHFGRGLCESESDFGFAGDQPVFCELLDWLACELIDSGWSLKHLHRIIVTSAVYQQPSWPEPNQLDVWQKRIALDRDNRLWSRFPRRRLEAEAIRDAMLYCAGMLNEERGGPGVRPPLEPLLASTLLKGQWDVTPREADHYRRSIYLFARRNLRWPMFKVFDRPSAEQSCPRRHQSTTALQALHLINAPFSHQMARCAAERLLCQTDSIEQAVIQAVRSVWGRDATPNELARLHAFVKEQHDRLGLSPLETLSQLYLALFNSNAFLYVD